MSHYERKALLNAENVVSPDRFNNQNNKTEEFSSSDEWSSSYSDSSSLSNSEVERYFNIGNYINSKNGQ